MFERLFKRQAQQAPLRVKHPNILFVANSRLATLEISFFEPLATLVDTQCLSWTLLTEDELRSKYGSAESSTALRHAIELCNQTQPTLIVFCRYSGPHARDMAAWARAHKTPLIYHIDDNLLEIPRELGEAKWKFHNSASRLDTVTFLLGEADLVYCSTRVLAEQLGERVKMRSVYAGAIYCASDVITPPRPNSPPVIGYMGTDHRADLEPVVPAIVDVLSKRLDARFEIFGGTPIPAALACFEKRIKHLPSVAPYKAFRDALANVEWAVGLCVLTRSRFNLAKADTKWVEYTASGIAAVASTNTVYDRACADECGMLASTTQEWSDAILRMLDSVERLKTIERAQDRLLREYAPSRLTKQVLEVFKRVGVDLNAAVKSELHA